MEYGYASIPHSTIPASVTRYCPIAGHGYLGSSVTNIVSVITDLGGGEEVTFSDLHVNWLEVLDGADGVVDLWYSNNNGASYQTGGVVCTVTDGNSYAADLVNSKALVAGNLVCWRIVMGALDSTSSMVTISCKCTSVHQWIPLNRGDPALVATTEYAPFNFGSGSAGVPEEAHQNVFPTNGSLSHMRTWGNSNPDSGTDGYDITVNIDGVGSASTIRMIGSARTGFVADSVAVTAGKLVGVEYAPFGTPDGTPYFMGGISFVPDIAGEFVVMGTSVVDYPSGSIQEYGALFSNRTNYDPTESNNAVMSPLAFTAKKWWTWLSVGPGADPNSRIHLLMQDGNPTALGVTLILAETLESDLVNEVAISVGEWLSHRYTPNSTPATTRQASSFVGYICPTRSVPVLFQDLAHM